MVAYHRIDLTPALDERTMLIKAMKDQARIAGVPEEKLDLIDKAVLRQESGAADPRGVR